MIKIYQFEVHDTLKKVTLYNDLNETFRQVASRNICVVVGDFNAKTGTGHEIYPKNIGPYGKGIMNSSGSILLEMLAKHDMVITNTLFKHKMAHRTTWTAITPLNNNAYDGTPRRNPYRNQIDYIITRNTHRRFVTDARSYSGFKTSTDHKLVKMTMNINWFKMTKPKQPNDKRININNFSNKTKRDEYTKVAEEKYQVRTKESNPKTPQERWNIIAETCKEAGHETLGTRTRRKKYEDPLLSKLSSEQYQLKQKIESATSQKKREELRKERRTMQKQINNILKSLEEKELEEMLKPLEAIKDDSNKAHHAVRALNSMKPKKPLYIENEQHQVVGSPKEQLQIIHEHFNRCLAPSTPSGDNTNNEIDNYNCNSDMGNNSDENNNNIPYPPKKMTKPFTTEEIRKAINSMKNGKSAGPDNVNAEFLKYAPKAIIEDIAKILNETAETGSYPSELNTGILTPLPKPGKKQGPPSNLRPIILLSVLRKILAICMINRTWDRLKTQISIDQAAYQPGRSTTEQVFAVKTLAEKAISSSDYTIYLLMLDMSKAFDTVSRGKLMKDLETILQPDEMHLMNILINDVKIHVRVGQETQESPIETTTGICQGDCLSAVLFIFYLANSIKDPSESQSIPSALEDHGYPKSLEYNPFTIAPKYADDTTWVTTNKQVINDIKATVPKQLKERNLLVNDDKTEEYEIRRRGDTNWKNCKLLGSKLSTTEDIERRKALTIAAMLTLKNIFRNSRISDNIKIRVFQAYINSIFLYNSELWTITNTTARKLDAFQRRQLRYALNIHWPKIISNEELIKRCKIRSWSSTILQRRLSWLGHLMRLPPDTPARRALQEALTPAKRPQGRPSATWLSIIKKDLEDAEILTKEQCHSLVLHLEPITANRVQWATLVRNAISKTEDAR
jgi:hypothetical protein